MTLTTNWQEITNYRFAPGTGFICTFYLDAKYSTQSKENNTTTIQTRLRSVVNQGYGSGNNYSFSCSYAPTVSGSGLWTFRTETITSGETTITHEQDGSKTINLSANARITGINMNISMNSDVIIPKINRYPVLTSGQNFNDEENPVYNISAFGLFPIRVKLEAGGDTQLITRDLDTQNSTQYTLELTNEERNILRNLATNSKTLNVIETVCAMDGNTELSANYKPYTMTIVNADPTYTYTIEETNENVSALLGTSANSIVKNASVVNINVSPMALKNATINNVSIIHNNKSYIKTESPYSFDIPITSNSFSINVTDSRTNTTTETITKTLIDYLPVDVLSVNFKRVNPTSSNIIVNLEATYYQQTFGSTANVPIVKWKLDENNWVTIPSTEYTIDNTNHKLTISNYVLTNALVYTSQGTFTISIEDKLTTDQDSKVVIKGIPTCDWGEHDFKVNGDLYIADQSGNDKVNVLELISQIKGTTLYENVTGSSGTIALSDSVENYDYIEIIYRNNDMNKYSTGKIWNNKNSFTTSLISGKTTNAPTVYIKTRDISCSGTSITNDYYAEVSLSNNVNISASNNTFILKVIGYID